MYLVKLTDKKWQEEALVGNSIRTGSILNYREIDDLRFRDEDEDQGRVVYKSKVLLEKNIHNKIFADGDIRLTSDHSIDMGAAQFYPKEVASTHLYTHVV